MRWMSLLIGLAGCRDLLGFEEAVVADGPVLPTVAFEQPTTRTDEVAGTIAIQVVLSAPATTRVTVPYKTVDGSTADPDMDFSFADPTGGLAFAPGETRTSIGLSIANDGIDEPEEAILLGLDQPDGAIVDAAARTHEITIATQPPPVLAWQMTSIDNVEEVKTIDFPVLLDRPSSVPVTFAFAVTGTAGQDDFTLVTSSPVTISAGATLTTVTLVIAGDALPEPAETVELTLMSATNATIPVGDAAVATLTIFDND